MQPINHTLRFRTAYNQFYLCDKDAPGSTDSPEFWTEQAFDDKLAVEEGILGICTGTYSYVKGELSLRYCPPDETDFACCDHVVEGSLEIKAGILQVLDCPDSTVIAEFAVAPGCYRVRVRTAGLSSIIDEEAEADDTYVIDVWPAVAVPRRVLKKSMYSY